MREDKKVILKAENLSKIYMTGSGKFGVKKRKLAAVDKVSFEVYRGETLGIVGESGCGKSTLGKLIMRLLEPSEGEVYFEGEGIFQADRSRLRALREKMQIVFQDPYASLNPRMTIGDIIGESLEIAGRTKDVAGKVKELMQQTGLNPQDIKRFPNEFSGGQRQRVCIARAIALGPELLVCDEPVSALDVSVQSQILNLFNRLKRELGLTYLFISHDLSVVRHVSDRICVMYLGNIVEMGEAEEVYRHPLHPYTRCLLSAVLKPVPHSRSVGQKNFIGEITGKESEMTGCPFYPRCPDAKERCKERKPDVVDAGRGHIVRCMAVGGLS